MAFFKEILVHMGEQESPIEGFIILPSNYVERIIFSIKVLMDGKVLSAEILDESIMLSSSLNYKFKAILKMLFGFDKTGVVIFRKDFEKKERLSTLIA